MSQKAFTLIELIAVLVIVGVLSTLGITQFVVARERALGREAEVGLRLIDSAERISRMESDNTVYRPCQCIAVADCNDSKGNPVGCNPALSLSLTPGNWSYAVTIQNSGQNYTATATRAAGAGGGGLNFYAGCTYTITDQSVDHQPQAGNNCVR